MTMMTERETNKNYRIWIRDIKVDTWVKESYLVKSKRSMLTKKGDPYLSMILSDKTGQIEARVWDRVEELSAQFKEGDVIHIEGYVTYFKDSIQLNIKEIRPHKGKIDPSVFLESTSQDISQMMKELEDILGQIKNPYLQFIIDEFLKDSDFMTSFKRAPAGKNLHHPYLGGLLEHTLNVMKMCTQISELYPFLDRELLLCGAFLHDIGKIKEYQYDLHFDYTHEGRLLGHLILGISMLEEKIRYIDKIPKDLILRLKHLILSHHGEYEFGSPKRPKILEAVVLHLVDEIDAKINGIYRFFETDGNEGLWTGFSRVYDRFFLKGIIPDEDDLKNDTGFRLQEDLFNRT